MTSWSFENQDSLQLNSGFLKLSSSALLESACFPQQGFVLGFSLVFWGLSGGFFLVVVAVFLSLQEEGSWVTVHKF